MAQTEPSTQSLAEKLKQEGNALYSEQKYAEAEAKYTEALSVGGDNAILYANRAACRLKLLRFVDATSALFFLIDITSSIGLWVQRQTQRRQSYPNLSITESFSSIKQLGHSTRPFVP